MYLDLCVNNCIADVRFSYGLSQSDLASRVGISRNALSSIELGQAYPRLNVAFALAEALHTPITTLFYIQERII